MNEKYETGAGTVVTDHDAKVEKKHDFSNDKVHPVGSGVGAAAGAATGAAVGTAVAGPVGTLVGAAVGAVAGGLLGHGVAEGTNPTVEDAYWRENYGNRPYANASRTYDDYQPAYRYGWESKARYGNKTWNEVEPELGSNWNDYNQGSARQTWDEAKLATKDAWHRVEDRTSGDVNRDRV
ncbi:MAG TPA: glycine zipper domain-containing protein [Thermoanaerobaculia bacterium]|nr:glycine zipper domain-containing protein [Thermoanaerobaculia bacterium]